MIYRFYGYPAGSAIAYYDDTGAQKGTINDSTALKFISLSGRQFRKLYVVVNGETYWLSYDIVLGGEPVQ